MSKFKAIFLWTAVLFSIQLSYAEFKKGDWVVLPLKAGKEMQLIGRATIEGVSSDGCLLEVVDEDGTKVTLVRSTSRPLGSIELGAKGCLTALVENPGAIPDDFSGYLNAALYDTKADVWGSVVQVTLEGVKVNWESGGRTEFVLPQNFPDYLTPSRDPGLWSNETQQPRNKLFREALQPGPGNPKTTFSDLPPELVGKVAGFLEHADIARLVQVSRSMSDPPVMAQARIEQKDTSYERGPVPYATFRHRLATNPLRRAWVSFSNKAEFLDFLGNDQTYRFIEFRFDFGFDVGTLTADEWKGLSQFKNLKVLLLIRDFLNGQGNGGILAIAPHLKLIPNLRTLVIQSQMLRSVEVQNLAPQLGSLTGLENLVFAGNLLNAAAMQGLALELGKLSTLKTLDLSSNCFEGAGLEAVARQFSNWPDLTYLNFKHNIFKDLGAEILSVYLSKLSRLTSLGLADTGITRDGVNVLAGKLPLHLKVLDLGDNELIANKGMEFLAPHLARLSELEELYLNEMNMDNRGLKKLLPGLQSLPNLRTLSLWGNRFKIDDDFGALEDQLAALPLNSLYIGNKTIATRMTEKKRARGDLTFDCE